MKKQLLFSLLTAATALFAPGAASAQTYVYTHTAKYVVTGENKVANSNFDSNDGWVDAEGTPLEAANGQFSQYWDKTTDGPDGQNALVSMGSDASLVCQVSDLSAGDYVVSFFVKGETAFYSSISATAANYIDVFANATGALGRADGDVQIAQAEMIGSEWTQVAYHYTLESSGNIVVSLGKIAAGTMFGGLTVAESFEVFDDRLAQRQLAYAERLLADPNLPNGREDFASYIEEDYKTALAGDDKDDVTEMMNFVNDFDNYVTGLLNANGANLMPTYLKDWSEWGKINYNNLTTKDNWTFEGGRWGCTGNQNYLEFSEGEGYICSAGIQTSQNALNVGLRTREGKLDNLPYGKYFFSIEVQAVTASNRANPYGADHSVVIAEPWFFFGSENITQPDTLNGYYWKTLYAVGEIKEGQEKVIGFHFPVLDHKKGGRYSVRTPRIFLLGESEDEMNFKALKSDFIVQQQNLNKRLTEYPVELNATDYPWEQDSLARAISTAQPVYDASLLIIDAEGNVLNKEGVTEERIKELLDQVNALGRARSFVMAQNAPIATLKETVAAANAVLNGPAYAGASASARQNLQAAVGAGQALLDAISQVNQGEAFAAATAEILAMKEVFEATSASRANPAEILIENGDFTAFSANANYTPGSNGELKNGWHWSMGASTSRWEIRDNETLSQGHGATVWRGTTVGLDGKCRQTADLTYEGLYEYRAEAYISEERVAELVAAAQVLETGDTIFTPNIRLFFGEDGLPDSVAVSKWYNGVKADGTYFTREVNGTKYGGIVYATYSVFFKKTGAQTLTAEFGLEALENTATAGANGFGFGNSHVYFLGDEAHYLTDTRAALTAAVAAARELAEAHPDSYWTVKLNRYIADAEAANTAKQMQNALWGIQEVSSRLGGLASGIQPVATANTAAAATAKGVYTLAGVRVAQTTDGLQPGLYIVNGKKVVVK